MRTATFWLITVNSLLFLIHVIISEYSDFKFNDYLSSYNIYSENFKVFTLITSNFSHANFEHIFWNSLLFMLVGFAVERRLGLKKYVLIITISSFSSSFLFHIDDYFVQKEIAAILKQYKLIESDIKFTPTKEVDVKNSSIFKKLNHDKAWDISHKFGFSKGNSKGFSGCLFAIMACFLVLFHYKRFVLNLIVLFFIAMNIIVLFEKNLFEHFTQVVHLGGVVVGIIFTAVVLITEYRKRKFISQLKYIQIT